MNRIESIFSSYRENFIDDFYWTPDIPEKKLANALSTYIALDEDEQIICLYNNSAPGSAKKSLALSTKGIYWKELYEDSNYLCYCDIGKISVEGNDLYILSGKNGNLDDEFKLPFENSDFPGKLKKLLTEIFEYAKDSNMPNNTLEKGVNVKDSMPNNTLEKGVNAKDSMPNNTLEKGVNVKDNMPNNTLEKGVNAKDSNMPNNTLEKGVESIIRSYQEKLTEDNFYWSPDIPEKKLANALNSYIILDEDEQLIYLYDSTFFGSAKEGVALSTKGIYWKELYEGSQYFSYCDIEKISRKGDDLYLLDEEDDNLDDGIKLPFKEAELARELKNLLIEAAKYSKDNDITSNTIEKYIKKILLNEKLTEEEKQAILEQYQEAWEMKSDEFESIVNDVKSSLSSKVLDAELHKLIKYCHNCGTQINDNVKFCSNCGTNIATPLPSVLKTKQSVTQEDDDEEKAWIICKSCGKSYYVENEDEWKKTNVDYHCDCSKQIEVSFFGTCYNCNKHVGFRTSELAPVLFDIAIGALQGFLNPLKAIETTKRFVDNIPSSKNSGYCPFCNKEYIKCYKCGNSIEANNADDNFVYTCSNCNMRMRMG